MDENKAYEIEIRKELDKFFPDEFIPANFHFYGVRALQHQSLPSLKCGIETYEKIQLFLGGEISKITFYEISFLINAIGSATPHQLIKEDDIGANYVTSQRDVLNLSKKWNEIVEPIKESVRRRVKAHIIRGIDPISNGKKLHL